MLILGQDCSPFNFSKRRATRVLLWVAGLRTSLQRATKNNTVLGRSYGDDYGDFSEVAKQGTGKDHRQIRS